nr:hypothetical protein BaRGS_013530 [Batillaria attramentaria]
MCCGGGTGLFVFPPFLNFLMMEFGWKGALWIHSGVVLNGVVLGFAYGKRKQKKTTEIPKKELENEVSIVVVGMASTVGRVVFGWLSDMRWANPLVTNGVTLAVGGVATSLVPFVKTYSQLATFSALYGACMGAFVTLRIPILVKLLGPHRLADSFGFLCLAHGLGAFAGPPLAGFLSDLTGSFNTSFYGTGATIGFSGVLSLYLCWISRRANPNTYAFEVETIRQ